MSRAAVIPDHLQGLYRCAKNERSLKPARAEAARLKVGRDG
jgi:hypothetical protein